MLSAITKTPPTLVALPYKTHFDTDHTCSSESKSGLDKSIKKNGAGAHSWGTLLTDPVTEPLDDGEYSSDEAEGQDQVSNISSPTAGSVSNTDGEKKTRDRSTSNVSVEDVLNAREFRKGVFSNNGAQGQSPSSLDLFAEVLT
jgi:hypothetical protein